MIITHHYTHAINYTLSQHVIGFIAALEHVSPLAAETIYKSALAQVQHCVHQRPAAAAQLLRPVSVDVMRRIL